MLMFLQTYIYYDVYYTISDIFIIHLYQFRCMNKSIELLIAFDDYQQRYTGETLEDFCRYYLAKNSKTKELKTASSRGLLLKIIGRISSAFSLYHRAAMDKTELPSPEGFYYLNGLTV